ncbi:MAG TPA: hypothetical protein VN723_13650 [Rhizomicrobium sp.]|nr:hypothetical protein [Rhizomicrobium sp.]
MAKELPFSFRDVVEPTHMTVFQLQAFMYWPDDEVARDRWIAAHVIECHVADMDDMPEAVLREFSKMLAAARNAPSLDGLRGDAAKRMKQGVALGAMILRAVASKLVDGRATALTTIRKGVAADLKPFMQIEPQTMVNRDSVFHSMRPSGHLWAAYYFACVHDEKAIFPCARNRVDEFLATAEAIRELAEITTSPNSSATVLRAGEALSIKWLAREFLPPVSFELAPPIAH